MFPEAVASRKCELKADCVNRCQGFLGCGSWYYIDLTRAKGEALVNTYSLLK